MAYACSTCGKVMASEGGMAVHLASHVAQTDADTARAAAAARALEAAAVPAETAAGPRPPGAPPVVLLGVVIVLLLVAGLVGAANPHLIRKQTGVSAAASPTTIAIPSTTTTVLPAGFRLASTDQFEIAFPAGWTDLQPGKADLNRALDAAAQANPKIKDYLTQQLRSAAAQSIKFLGIDTATGSNVNVALQGNVSGSVDDIPPTVLEAELRKAGATNLSHARVQLPAGDALVVSSQLPLLGRPAQITQYYLVANGTAYVVTVTTSPGGPAVDSAAIASTFRTN